MKTRQRTIFATGVSLVGLICVLASGLVSNNVIEQLVLGNVNHSLSWGPTLFRVLLAFHGLLLIVFAKRLDKVSEAGSPSNVSGPRTNWQTWFGLIVLSLIALGLRLWRLNTDLWFDELLTLLNYVRLPVGYIVSRLPDQNNHIVFSLLSHASVSVFGESAWAVRLPSVLFGVMSLWALFLLGRRLLETREAFLTAALATFSYHHIWFSQNARGYMALLFFSVLATWIWVEALRRNSWGWWIAYSLAVAGGMWSHLTMVFVVAAHAVVYFITLIRSLTGKEPKSVGFRPLVSLCLGATITLQLYALALPEFLQVGMHEVSLESEWTNPWWVVTETWRNLKIGFSGMVILSGGAAMLGIGWLSMLRRDWRSGLLMVLPPVLAGGSMLASGHNLWPRFFFFAMGFALLIAVHGAMLVPRLVSEYLMSWPRAERIGTAAGLTLASFMILASAITVPRNYAHPKQDYSGARDFVEAQRGPNDAVVAVGLAGVAYRNYFAPKWSVAQTEAELDAVRRGKPQVWLVYTIPVEVKAYRKEVWQTIQNDFAVVKVFPGTLGGGEVVVCRQLPEVTHQLARLSAMQFSQAGSGGN